MPILLNRTRMYLNKPREADIDVPYCTMFSDAELLEIYEEFNYQDASLLGRPSNGFIVLLWLIKKAWVWKSLTLLGLTSLQASSLQSRCTKILLAGTFLKTELMKS